MTLLTTYHLTVNWDIVGAFAAGVVIGMVTLWLLLAWLMGGGR